MGIFKSSLIITCRNNFIFTRVIFNKFFIDLIAQAVTKKNYFHLSKHFIFKSFNKISKVISKYLSVL